MSPQELEEYETITIPKQMKRDRYNPNLSSNLNFEALEYMVSSFTRHDISVILISYPIHPVAIEALTSNQLDAHNTSIDTLLKYNGVSYLDLIWEGNWTRSDFYDFEHLDFPGRQKVCSIISNHLDSS